MATLPRRKHRHDHRSRIARNPHRTGRQRRLIAKKPNGSAVQEEITIGQKYRDLAAAQRLNDFSNPGRTRFDDGHGMRSAEEGDGIEQEAARRASSNRGEAIAMLMKRLADKIKSAKMGSDQHHPVALGECRIQN
jgi:hypothetical protein